MSARGALTGTGRLTRLALRRDRIKALVWALGLPLVGTASASSVTGLYATEQDRVGYATTTAASVVARAFNGPTAGPSLGSVVTAETLTSLVVLTALLSTFTVVRHTRQNEETGRAEILGSAVVGRHAPLVAALLTVTGVNLVAGLGVGVFFVALGLPVGGSFVLGAAVTSVGLAFGAVAAVTAQVASTSRGANGLASAVVGLAFLLRAVGDALGRVGADGMSVVSAWPSWLSPLGWANQLRPYDDDRWWLLALPVGFTAAAVWLAFALTNRRDFGAGLMAVRPGPPTASPRLLSPLGLAWRLQRGVLLGWAIGVVVLGVSFGVVGDEVESMLGDNERAAEVIAQLGGGAELVDAFLSTMLRLFALAIAGYTTQALLRMRAEESTGPLEGVLAAAVSRPRWLASHLLCAVSGTVGLILLAGASTGLGYGAAVGDVANQTLSLAGAALVQVPAVLALAGVVLLLFGLVPRWSVELSWAVLIACLLLWQLGGVLDLPQPVLDVSPFTHTPGVPADELALLPLIVLLGVAVALGAAGTALFRRRDLTV